MASSYENLFGQYYIELAKFFKQFKSYRKQDGQFEDLRVIYGTPSAAFKRVFNRVNGLMDLPFLNFKAINFQRQGSNENPFVRLRGPLYDNDTKVTREHANQHWDINFNVNLYTANYQERDDLMYKILTSFEGIGETYLKYLKDPQDPNTIRYVHVKIEEDWQDETDIEALPEKETLDIIRTAFVVHIKSALVEYYGWSYDPVKSIQTNTTTKGDGTFLDDGFTQWRIDVLSGPTDPLAFEVSTNYF